MNTYDRVSSLHASFRGLCVCENPSASLEQPAKNTKIKGLIFEEHHIVLICVSRASASSTSNAVCTTEGLQMAEGQICDTTARHGSRGSKTIAEAYIDLHHH